MATTFDKASLVMIPSGYKDDKLYSIKPTDGSGDFTFSRDGAGASPATRVNASGLIEKGRTNEILQSNTFSNASWVKTNSSVTSGQSGYDGSTDAWKVDISAGAGKIQQSVSTSGVQTISTYAKAGTINFMRISIDGGNGQYFDLSTGSLGTQLGTIIDAKIESIGSGWYRCSIVASQVITAVPIYPAVADNDLTGTSGNIYIQDAQLEQGLVATDYIETTTAPVSAGLLGDMPRLDYSGGATCGSLLLEPSRANSITQSEYVDSWGVKTNISVVSNSGTSPEGVVNASNIYPTATGACFFYEGSITYTSGTTYTYSVFAKANGKDYLQITTSGASFSNQYCTFDLSLGATDNNGFESVGIEDYGNGWYRCYVVETSISTASSRFVIGLVSNANAGRLSSVTANGTDGVLIYGVVNEVGSYPTSYIPTYGSASTRGLDNPYILSQSSLIGQTEGTIYAELKSSVTSPAGSLFISVSDGTSNNRVLIGYAAAANSFRVVVIFSSVSNGGDNYSITDSTEFVKVAVKYTSSSVDVFINGVKQTSQSGGSFNATLDKITFDNGTGANKFEGDIKQRLHFNTALTDAECIALTTI